MPCVMSALPFLGIGLIFFGLAIAIAAYFRRPTNAAPEPVAHSKSRRSELSRALSQFKSAFLSVFLFSAMINVLMLTGAFFMLQVYDRVLPSRSVPTLVALGMLVVGLFAVLALLEAIRSRMLVRIGASLDEAVSHRVYDALIRLPLRTANRGDGLQPLRDLDAVRSFLSGPGPTALFDMPFMPLYLAIIFAFHTSLGVTAIVGALILIGLTLLTDALARQPMRETSEIAQTRNGLAEAGRRNAEVLAAMGMARRMTDIWGKANASFLASNQRVSDITGSLGSLSKTLRMLLQSVVLGMGAYLVILQEASPGIIIAATILVARALAPVDVALANWRGFLAARQSWKRLTGLLEALPGQDDPMALPAPGASLTVENVTAIPPGGRKPVVHGVSFKLTSRARSWRCRAECIGQVLAGAHARRSLASRPGTDLPGQCRARPMVAGSAWTIDWVYAAGLRIVCRNRGRKHRPV